MKILYPTPLSVAILYRPYAYSSTNPDGPPTTRILSLQRYITHYQAQYSFTKVSSLTKQVNKYNTDLTSPKRFVTSSDFSSLQEKKITHNNQPEQTHSQTDTCRMHMTNHKEYDKEKDK